MRQEEALAILKSGRNVFLTGEPGAGKTYTINAYVNWLRSHGISVAVTASTGIAATHLGGMTVHSFSGIGISKSLSPAELKEIAGKKIVRDRIKNVSVLVIDEISMLDSRTLELIDAVCKAIKEPFSPFGGLQTVFVGDFFQLPPVARFDDPVPPQFAFQSFAWQQAAPAICYLSEQHRQEDARFLEVLSALRRGTITEEHIDRLREREVHYNDIRINADLTKLYPHNADVDRMNLTELNKLPDKPHSFAMKGFGIPPLIEQLKRGCLSPDSLVLKKGAQVMFTKNAFFDGYVNGTTGQVADFDRTTGLPVVRLRNGNTIIVEPTEWKIETDGRSLASIVQLPLRLAWAMTVHKSQGMSLDAAFVDLSQAFAYGQGYVALSRVRTLAGLHLGGLNTRALEVDSVVREVDLAFREQSDDVRFSFGGKSVETLKELHDAFILKCDGVLNELDKKLRMSGAKAKKPPKEKRWEQTLALILSGKTIEETAAVRSRTVGTIIEHLEDLQSLNKLSAKDLAQVRKTVTIDLTPIHDAFKVVGTEKLSDAFKYLEGKHSYEDLRLARLFFS